MKLWKKLQDLLQGRCDTPCAAIHRMPRPQVDEGLWLGTRSEVTAMMDLSDGLASDVRHIMECSGVGADIDLERIPTAPGIDLRTAACAGEDYKLLLCAEASGVDSLMEAFEARFGAPLYPLGRITGTHELRWCEHGTPSPLDWQGFHHY